MNPREDRSAPTSGSIFGLRLNAYRTYDKNHGLIRETFAAFTAGRQNNIYL